MLVSRFARFILLLVVTIQFSLNAFAAANPNIPGGKWMPHQMSGHANKLRALGLEIDPAQLTSMETGLLRAIISLSGFCSGSFISPNGLIITNHHCAQSLLSYLSQKDRERGIQSDFVTNGFYAKTQADERSAGPDQKIFVTQKIEDVTSLILNEIDQIKDPFEKRKTIERRMAELVKSAETGRPDLKVEVREFYRSSHFYLVEQLELKDVRVVYAPPAMVGYFGGDTDNWRFPRHTGDFAVLRAYVAPDGSTASYDEKNVPYQPKQILKVAPNGLAANDLVMVAGYPGHTNRLITTNELSRQMNETIPDVIRYFNLLVNTYDQLAKSADSSSEAGDLRVKVESARFSAANVLKKNQDQLNALERENFLKTKIAQEQEFQTWLRSDPQRMLKYGWAQLALEDIYKKHQAQLDDALASRLTMRSPLLNSALTIVRMADERAKPDEEREPTFKERNWKRISQAEVAKQGRLDRRIDVAVYNAIVKYTDETVATARRPAYATQLIEEWKKIPNLAEQLFAASTLENLDTRMSLLNEATLEQLQASKDSTIQFALRLLPEIKNAEKLSRAYQGEISKPMRLLMEALQEYSASKGELLAPDANSTLRLTYGQAKGYYSKTRGRMIPPFTNARGILDKNRPGSEEFEVPHQLVRALHIAYFDPERKKDVGKGFGPLGDSMFGDLPVNFLANVDTTGGNSGSAAINKHGELIGLLFDGNDDSLAVDFRFDEEGDRSILVTMNYIAWYLSKVDGAHRLIEEMTISDKTCRDYLLSR